jgi:hypothetical protein
LNLHQFFCHLHTTVELLSTQLPYLVPSYGVYVQTIYKEIGSATPTD